ncbi:hypothetical protein KAFR_0D02470 [Kazachstania africana CBS 2517]|uniref:Zinc finger PHD-type domain-containing protein n=1 Tax=Kazachstania africana (strain ATCC 22294 / BCRC 22015 / CBS 2517 / CECT 1963 / NBRC 1671 / NRRL Y-8276) TaxID=1071382 RepID=H2AU44_KAZAF|nr:hypothetical protein KAFR_0D02470 [Kazachstania africana CBS 2517]CCF57894.1 hypothetical protein KAFR_0D02470 [Kazachstania africana CBS 2517]
MTSHQETLKEASDSDIRYSFINTLDHFPSDIIRTLWLIQSLDIKLQKEKTTNQLRLTIVEQSEFLNSLIDEQISKLDEQKRKLKYQQIIKKRYFKLYKDYKPKRLKIKINLREKKFQELQKRKEDEIRRKQEMIDSNVERYCFCNDVSYGDMIACDNTNCKIEWFHYGCVGLKNEPTGKWYCSDTCKLEATKKKSKKKGK